MYRGNKWVLAPAYDLTRCLSGYNGEHATTVNNNGVPTLEDMLMVGESIRIARSKGMAIIREMQECCKEILIDDWKER